MPIAMHLLGADPGALIAFGVALLWMIAAFLG
jgi:hypothetical protein